MTDVLDTANSVMQQAVDTHKPVRIFALFSGGKDSIASTHFAMERGAHEVLHINTGIGIEETREFVRETCKSYGWPLREIHPPEKGYDEFVLKYGFPGPAAHRYSYVWLKEKPLRKLIRETKTQRSDRVMLVTGVRNQESARRMGFVEPIIRIGAWLWVAPLYKFSDIDLADYRKAHNLPLSAVSQSFGMSGECLCGAFAAPGEMARLERLYPATAQRIHDLEARAKTAGVHCEWGKRPHRGKASDADPKFMPLCVACPTKEMLHVL